MELEKTFRYSKTLLACLENLDFFLNKCINVNYNQT